MSTPILMLALDGDSTRIVYNHLSKVFGPIPAVIENRISRKTLLKIRIRKLGLLPVVSQLGFLTLVRPLLERIYATRITKYKAYHKLDCSALPQAMVTNVPSINCQRTIELIATANPRVIVVNGTRIISKKVLESTDAIIINTHTGITPQYRGAHGGYWALYHGDLEHCGVTVHLVDAGIDTGAIISQKNIHPTRHDSFVTYLYLQTATALPLLARAVNDALSGSLEASTAEGRSAVWYHPGFFQYVAGWIRGIR